MSKSKINITAKSKGVSVECDSCSHDVEVAQACAQAVAACANACCGSEGCGNALALIERTVVALGGHITSTDCLSKGFGLAGKGKKGKGGIHLKDLACLDSDTCKECIDVVLSCNDKNGCISEKGLRITPDCFAGLYKHAVESGCISSGFGHCNAGKSRRDAKDSACGC